MIDFEVPTDLPTDRLATDTEIKLHVLACYRYNRAHLPVTCPDPYRAMKEVQADFAHGYMHGAQINMAPEHPDQANDLAAWKAAGEYSTTILHKAGTFWMTGVSSTATLKSF